MTRTERLTAYLQAAPGPDGEPIPDMVQSILAIADDRQLLTTLDLAELLGRPPSTVKSWVDRHAAGIRVQTRRTVVPPPVAYQTRSGPLWDAEVVTAWIAEHPGF